MVLSPVYTVLYRHYVRKGKRYFLFFMVFSLVNTPRHFDCVQHSTFFVYKDKWCPCVKKPNAHHHIRVVDIFGRVWVYVIKPLLRW